MREVLAADYIISYCIIQWYIRQLLKAPLFGPRMRGASQEIKGWQTVRLPAGKLYNCPQVSAKWGSASLGSPSLTFRDIPHGRIPPFKIKGLPESAPSAFQILGLQTGRRKHPWIGNNYKLHLYKCHTPAGFSTLKCMSQFLWNPDSWYTRLVSNSVPTWSSRCCFTALSFPILHVRKECNQNWAQLETSPIGNELCVSRNRWNLGLSPGSPLHQTPHSCSLILYYTILYYTILYYDIIRYNMIYYNTVYNIYHTIPYGTIPYHTIPYYNRTYYNRTYDSIQQYTICDSSFRLTWLSPQGAWWWVLVYVIRWSYQHSLERRSSVAK